MIVRRLLLAVLCVGLVTTGIGGAHAAFTATTANSGNAIATATTFPQSVFLSAWSISDRSTGTATDRSHLLSYADGREYEFTERDTTYSASRYARFDFGARLQDGLVVTNATVNVRMRVNDTSDDGCFRLHVYRRSDSTLLTGPTPQQCTASLAYVDFTVDVTATLNTSTKVNDVSLRVNGWYEDSTASNNWFLDRVTMSVTTAQGTVTMYPDTFIDAMDGDASNGNASGVCQQSQSGSGSEGPWGPIAVDAACLRSNGNWPTSYSNLRYVDFVVPTSHVPGGATILRARLVHTWRPTAAVTTCYFVEARVGGVAIGTYGSSGSPLACHATTSNSTETVDLTDVTTPARANGLTLRMYYWGASSVSTSHDRLRLEVKFA